MWGGILGKHSSAESGEGCERIFLSFFAQLSLSLHSPSLQNSSPLSIHRFSSHSLSLQIFALSLSRAVSLSTDFLSSFVWFFDDFGASGSPIRAPFAPVRSGGSVWRSPRVLPVRLRVDPGEIRRRSVRTFDDPCSASDSGRRCRPYPKREMASGDLKGFYRQKKRGSAVTKPSSSSSSKKKSGKAPSGGDAGQNPALVAHGSFDLEDDHVEEEQRLNQFDMDMKYGPCIGIPRLDRWERAFAMGLNPPPDIPDLILRPSSGRKPSLECLWDDRV